jgi:hypothetical protein
MKIKIGPYTNYIGPFQLAEKILFWKDKHKINEENPGDFHKDSDDIHALGEKLSTYKWIIKLCEWYNSRQKRKIVIKIDPYDTWSAYNTMALIITPLLKALKENKMGAPNIDDEDVPVELRSTSAPPLTEEEKNCGSTDANYFKRWDWVIDEMIWAFEQHSTDWEDQYYSGNSDIQFQKLENGFSTIVRGPADTFKVDYDGIAAHRARMENGRKLFAKYYECLWT